MRRPGIVLVVILLIAGVALITGFYTNSTLLSGLSGGLALGALIYRYVGQPRNPAPAIIDPHPAEPLMAILIDMGDALQATSPQALQQRGGWNQKLFDDVLAHIEQQAPSFQHALITYLAQPVPLNTGCVTALLAVDRLSAAYTYWTRLFPPRQSDDSMFVLSLLHDLSEKVERAITYLDNQLA